MLNKSEFGCVLKINTREIHPSIITNMTGLKALLCVKGEAKINRMTGETMPNSFYMENAWIYDCRFSENECNIEKSICEILKILSTNENFQEVFQIFDNFVLRCYAYVHDYNIVFSLSSDTLSLLQKIKIPIEFDLYSLSD